MTVRRPAFSYRLLSLALFFLWILHATWLALKYRQPDYLRQRAGFHPPCHHNPSIWVHAASVGEVEMIKSLLESLNQEYSILVTTFTITGFQHAQRILPENVSVRALPIDLLPISYLFIRRHHFKLALIAETELWPETLYQTARRQIPLLQINARLSQKTLNTANWSQQILRTTLGYFDRYLTRNAEDQANLLSMGAEADKISIVGNLKYAHSDPVTGYVRPVERPYILFASTHDPEEKMFAEICKALQLRQLVVIAPRHPQRAGEILKSLQQLDLRISQRSTNQAVTDKTQIYLADTLGELKTFMAFAELVIMGGSFNDTGGHNVLEPARLGKAIITGPSDQNIFQDIAMLAQHQAIIQVQDTQQLKQIIHSLITHPASRDELSNNARQVMQTQNHILQNYLKRIQYYL